MLPASGFAVTYTDGFTDGTLVGGADNSGLAWYRRSSNQTIAIANDAGIGSGNALQLTINGTTNQIDRAVIGVFSNFTLVNVGDQISLAFDFRFLATPTVNTADGLRFGFYNSNGTALTGSGTTDSDNDFGYQASIGTGSTMGYSLFKEQNTVVGGLGADAVDRNPLSPSVSNMAAIGDTLKHSLLFTIAKTASGVSFSTSVDGTLLGAGVDTSSPYLTFNEVVFNHGTPQGYAVDNVVVTATTIPEPATAGLIGLGLVGLLFRRRK